MSENGTHSCGSSLRWKEASAHSAAGDDPLLREQGQLCAQDRLLEIVHDVMVFDAGVKSSACRFFDLFQKTSTPCRSRTWIGAIERGFVPRRRPSS